MRSSEGLNTVPATRSSLASPAHLPPHLSPSGCTPDTLAPLGLPHLPFPHPPPPEAGRFSALRLVNPIPPLCPVNTHSSFEPQLPAHCQGTFPAALPTPSCALTVPHSSPSYSFSQLTGICVTTDHGPPPPWTTGQWR